MKANIQINKLQVVELQTNAAIEMLFSEYHPVPIHTVISSAFRVMRDLAKRNNSENLRRISNHIAPGKEGVFWKHVNKAFNFFKHADDDSDEVFEMKTEEINDLTIFWTIILYHEVAKSWTCEMRVFTNWFVTQRPDCVLDENIQKFIEASARENNLENLSRQDRLSAGRFLIQRERLKKKTSS